MSLPAIKESAQPVINYDDPKLLKTIQETVAKGATPAEFAMFIEMAKSTQLNPFKKELWFIKTGRGVQMMTGLNGFLAIANNHPQYDGMQIIVDNDQKPTKAVCRVYRKDRKYPAEGVALMSEYGKNTPIWREMPRVMLTKCAKCIALREAFPQEMNGLYAQEEMPAEYSSEAATVSDLKQAPTEETSAKKEPPQTAEPPKKPSVELVPEPITETVYIDKIDSFQFIYAARFAGANGNLQALQEVARKSGYMASKEHRCWVGDTYVRAFEKYYIHKPKKGWVNDYEPTEAEKYIEEPEFIPAEAEADPLKNDPLPDGF